MTVSPRLRRAVTGGLLFGLIYALVPTIRHGGPIEPVNGLAVAIFSFVILFVFGHTSRSGWSDRAANVLIVGLALPVPVAWLSGRSVEPLVGIVAALVTFGGIELIRRVSAPTSQSTPESADTRVLVVGAGEAGEMVLREIEGHESLRRRVIGYVDDDPEKQGTRVASRVPVLGKTESVAELCHEHDVDEVIIAMPSAPGSVIRSVTRQADRMNADLRIVPGIREIIEGDVHWNQIRNVQPEDLLGRETVEVDATRLEDYLRNKKILVTGAAGSIGGSLVEEILEYPVSRVLGMDINESDLYELEASELRSEQRDDFESSLVDIRDAETVRDRFRAFDPDIVLHAAALKHVPMSERHPSEVVKTNIRGTLNVLDSAVEAGVEDCLVISTDKAVNAENLMGLSKRVNELMVGRYQSEHEGIRFCAVRFGNVLGSRGSVVPLFKKQIERGGPVTVTDPEVERYFMTPTEAVKLVLTAASFEQKGALYVLELGDPIRILALAKQLISLSGYEPETEIPITFTGLREGETMEETLLADDEEPSGTDHEKIRWIESPQITDSRWQKLENVASQPVDDPDRLIERLRTIVE
jgi:FlaA1/EpsC-like NDP-sugar epimerase